MRVNFLSIPSPIGFGVYVPVSKIFIESAI